MRKNSKILMAMVAMNMMFNRTDEMFDSSRPPKTIVRKRVVREEVKKLYRKNRGEHPFTVKGKTIMAYSKKDAMKRYEHRKKKEGWK